jgi:hypothetical protein
MKSLAIVTLSAALVLLGACQLEEINVNPNDPRDVPMSTLLPAAQQSVARVHSGDAALIASIFSNYLTGFDALVQPLERYVVDNDFFMRPVWRDFYTIAMPTLGIIIDKADASNSPHYGGVGRVLQALCLGTATSVWGDIPFSEAFQGSANLTPEYDAQAMLYEQIQALLEEAIRNFEEPESVFRPGEDDLFFGGDILRWRAVAHTLRARYWLHTVKRDAQAAQKALEALADGIGSTQGELAYPATNQEFNPWYRYVQSTPNVRIDPSYSALMQGDPRRPFHIRSVFGELNLGTFYAGQFQPLLLCTWHEQNFLLAEVLVRTGQPGAQEALQEAIRTHMLRVSGNAIDAGIIQDYLDDKAALSGGTQADLAVVMREKYKASFLSIEGWTDFRRTGLPALQAKPDGVNPQNPNGEIPRRLPYPLNEILYNPNTPSPDPTMQDRFWWDE